MGKTTLARMMATQFSCEFIALSAVFSGIKEVREAVAQAEMWRGQGRRTILFVDEIHRFNKAQQDGFLPFVETGCSPSSARRPRTRRSRSIRRCCRAPRSMC